MGDAAMADTLRKGDTVRWNTSQGPTTGTVEEKLTAPCDIERHHVAESEDAPHYLVAGDKTGKRAAHAPDALTRTRAS